MATSATKIAIGVGCGILGALFLVMLLGLGTCAACVGTVATNMVESEAANLERLRHVRFENVSGGYEGDWFTVEGTVRNGGAEPISFVRVRVEALDAQDRVLDTDTTYAVGGDALSPGAAKTWRVMFNGVRGIESYRYSVAD